MLYTIVPLEQIWIGFKEEQQESFEIERNGIRLVVSPLDGRWGQIVRIISTNPADYLRSDLQPGSKIYIED